MNKRIRGRRIVLVLASRPSRPQPSAVGLTVAGAAAAAAAAAYLLHRIGQRSGATDQETDAVLPGDELVRHPMWESTRAITIDAPVEEVWPWIVQMGFPAHRAGWYTPYVLDRLTFGIRERSRKSCGPSFNISNRATLCLTAPTGRSTSRLPKSIRRTHSSSTRRGT